MAMHVLHVVKTGIGAQWALRQMRELVASGLRVTVALPRQESDLSSEYEQAGVRVIDADLSLPITSPWLLSERVRTARRVVDAAAPDIIHAHFYTNACLLRKALGVSHPTPRIFQVPGPLHLETTLFARTEMAMSGPRDYWIGSCGWTRLRYLSLGADPSRVFLSHYGTDLDLFSTTRTGAIRRILGVDERARLVGMVAHVYAPKTYLGHTRGIKGHEDFIDAFAEVRMAHPEATAVIIGAAWSKDAERYFERIKRRARRRCGDSIVFLGHRRDVPALYPELDVVAHPSLSENFGGAAESLLSGVPTITTTVGGFPELIRDGETGWLVPPRTPRALANAIVEVLESPQEAAIRASNGRRLAATIFEVRRTAAQIVSIYQRIMKRRDEARSRIAA